MGNTNFAHCEGKTIFLSFSSVFALKQSKITFCVRCNLYKCADFTQYTCADFTNVLTLGLQTNFLRPCAPKVGNLKKVIFWNGSPTVQYNNWAQLGKYPIFFLSHKCV